MVQGFFSRLTPGKWCMIAYQHHLHFGGIQVSGFETVDNLIAGFQLIVSGYPGVVHRRSAGHIDSQVVGMGCSKIGMSLPAWAQAVAYVEWV